MGCAFCIRLVKCVPVLFITLTICWSYYAYVYELCIGLVESIVEKTLLLVFFHWLFIMLLWSYQKTIFTDIARIPQQFKVSKEEQTRITTARNEEEQIKILREISKDLPLLNCTYSGCIRYCDRCQVIKPDRAHHCSVCGVCVLKMDHHCPWVNNCVNYSNYKFFLLFLGWALIYCLYVTFTMLSYFLEFWRGTIQTAGRFHLLFLFVVAIMFAFSLVSLFGYHVYLVLKNRTTLEAFRAPVFVNGGSDKSGFDLGAYKNFQEVFGTEKKYWFLPIQTCLGDGIRYQVRRGLLLEPC